MAKEIIVEIIDIEREEDQLFLWCDDVYTKERYLVYAYNKIFEQVRIGDIVRVDVKPGLPRYDDIKSFRARKVKLMARYPTKVRDVLDI
jgi:hypothetical protein